MLEKTYKAIKMVLNGSSFADTDKCLSYCRSGSRTAVNSWLNKLNFEVYKAGLTGEQLLKVQSLEVDPSNIWAHASPSIKFLRNNKAHFLNSLERYYAKVKKQNESTVTSWLSCDTMPLNGKKFLLKTTTGVVDAFYVPKCTTNTLDGVEYDGHWFSCYDDEFQIEIEGDLLSDPTFLGWMHIPE